MSELAIRGGRVIDPASGLDEVVDVYIDAGVVERVGGEGAADRTIDAEGLLVVPGLIDLHTHTAPGLSSYGIDPDRAGLQAGVTHVNDMGGSGWLTLDAMRRLVVSSARTPMTTFASVYAVGSPENWGVGAPEFFAAGLRRDELFAVCRRNSDFVRGIKVHMERGVVSHMDRSPWDAVSVARSVGDALGLPVFVHLGRLNPRIGGLETPPDADFPRLAVERMRRGDILGHCFTPHAGGLVAKDGEVDASASLASEHGILHEVGHGLNISFRSARAFLDAGHRPHIISSDVHGKPHCGSFTMSDDLSSDVACEELAWSMVGTMSKVLGLGVPLIDVVAMSTINPARVLGIDRERGSLRPGSAADVTLLEPLAGPFTVRDTLREEMRVETLLLPRMTVLGGEAFELDPLQLPEFRLDYVEPNPDCDWDAVRGRSRQVS